MADWSDCLHFGISVAKQAKEVRAALAENILTLFKKNCKWLNLFIVLTNLVLQMFLIENKLLKTIWLRNNVEIPVNILKPCNDWSHRALRHGVHL